MIPSALYILPQKPGTSNLSDPTQILKNLETKDLKVEPHCSLR